MPDIEIAIGFDDRGYSAGVDRVRRQTKQLTAEMQGIGHASVSSMQASSAAIRVLEGGMQGNIRAAERLISMLPGVGKALQGAFPIVGAIAVAGIFVRIGEETYKTIHAIEQMRNVTREAFLSMTESSTRGVDNMRVANDKLEQSIAMLEHKPVNTVALALDEARLKADELAISLNKDYTGFKKLLDESKTSILGQVLGKASGKDVQGGINDRLANIRTLGLQQQDQLEDGNTSGAADTLAKLKAAQAEARAWERQQVAMRQGKMASPNGDMLPYSSFYGNQGQNIDTLQGFGTIVRSQQNTQKEQERGDADAVTQKKIEAANKAQEAMKKAQDLLFKQDELAERQQSAFNRLTLNETIQFWNDRLAAFRKGSEQYIAVQDKIYAEISKRPDLTGENKKNQAAAGKFTVEGNDLLGNAQKALTTFNTEQLERQNKEAQKYNEIMAKTAEIFARNKAALDESTVSIGLEQGSISKLAAAQELAGIHAKQQAAALNAVNEELATQISLIKNDPNQNLSADDRAKAVQNAKSAAGNQVSALNGAYAVQQKRDQAGIDGDTISGAVKQSLSQMVQSFDDLATNLKNIIPRTIEGLNDDIVKAMTGHGSKQDFGRTLTDAGQGAMKAALQKVEGLGLSWLTHGKVGPKRDGSAKETALWVQIANAGAGVAGMSAAAASISTTAPGRTATLGLQSLVPGGSFIRPFIDALPHFAGGGDVLANRMSLVGERGPELFMPSTSGRIVPNNQLGGGDSGPHYHFHIQGNQDPMAVRAAIMSAAPHIAASTLQASHSMNKRTPRGR